MFLKSRSNARKTSVSDAASRGIYYEVLFQSGIDGYLIFDKNTLEITDHNKCLQRMLEQPETENLKGLYISQVMMRYLAADSANLELLMNKIPDDWGGEADFITYKKKRFTTFLKSSVFAIGELEFQLLCIRSTTEITTAKKELEIYKEKMEKAAKAKARFLSSMSHELRTPLNGIIGTSNLILEENSLPENIINHINILRYSSEHMLGIVNDILDFSKIDEGKMELRKQRFNVKDSLERLLKSFENEFKARKIELEFTYDPQLAGVFIISDDIKLNQVIANLLSNALKFTIAGIVTLKVSIDAISETHVSLFVEIKDTGIGIAQEKQAEIFKDFVQVNENSELRRFDGTGLGLTISEKLVKIFGGQLEVESELGKGSRFYFSLKFEVAPKTVKAKKLVPAPDVVVDIRGVRVLIVEDNEINANILKTFLLKWQMRVMEARNGVQALELVKYHTFDIILMDLEMPEMNGYDALKGIRLTNSNVPIVAFTAALLENMDQLITESGFTDYMLKPFRPSELKEKLEFYAPHRKIDYA